MRIRCEFWSGVAVFCLLVGVARAAGGAGPAPVRARHGTGFHVSRLGRLRAQETLLRAELAIAKLKAAIARERVSSALSTAPSGLVVLPEVRSVGGLARQVHAVVQYPDGSRMTVRAGSILANGIRVIRVQRRGVWVRLPAGQVRALGFAPGSLPALQTPGAPFIPARAGGAGVSSGPGGPG